MSGSVYVNNLTGEQLALNVNQGQVGTVGGWSYGEARFQLSAPLAVPRARLLDGEGRFANGQNHLGLQWDGRMSGCTVAIDGGRHPLNQDLLLLVAYNSWQLVDDRGEWIASGEVQPLS
jgi:hypothetical protein